MPVNLERLKREKSHRLLSSEYLHGYAISARNIMYWPDKIAPLEGFELEQSGSEFGLHFRDLAIERGYGDSGSRLYRFWLENRTSEEFRGQNIGNLDLSSFNSQNNLSSPDRFDRMETCHLWIQSKQRTGDWAQPAEVIDGKDLKSNSIRILGWQHAVHNK